MSRRIELRMLAGLMAGFLIAWVHPHYTPLSPASLVGFFVSAAGICYGMGLSRFLVGAAIWLGQYAYFAANLNVPQPDSLYGQDAVSLFRGIYILVPGISIGFGLYLGLVVEKIRQSVKQRAKT